MKFEDIKRHLAPYGIHKSRKTTINHAFAAAVAPCDDYAPDAIRVAIRLLDQNPDEQLRCVYCDADAETWDHVYATVKDSEFSGAGHRIGNLVPCCKACNSKKGNKSWEAYILSREADGAAREARILRIGRYLQKLFVRDTLPNSLAEYTEFLKIRGEILELMKRADVMAAEIRRKMKEAKPTATSANANSPKP